MLNGIGGCFMSNLLAAVGGARARRFRPVGRRLRHARIRAAQVFTDIVLRVNGGDADPAALREMIAKAEAGCIAINTAKSATGVTVMLA